jgi:Protein of unknown function (DUF2934)
MGEIIVLKTLELARTIGIAPQVFDRNRINEEIRRHAYQLYIRRGKRDGNDREDWLMAEEAVLMKYALLDRSSRSV